MLNEINQAHKFKYDMVFLIQETHTINKTLLYSYYLLYIYRDMLYAFHMKGKEHVREDRRNV